MVRREGARPRPQQENEQEADADHDVQAVQAGQREERRAVRAALRSERRVRVLVRLPEQEQDP